MSRESTLAQFESILAEGQIACVSKYMQPQEFRISRAKTSSPCMRFERCARERPCTLKYMQVPHLDGCDCPCLHIQQVQRQISDASRGTCKPPSRLDRPWVPIQQAETNHFLMVSRHMQAPIPPRFHGPCVHIQQADKTIGSCTDTCAMSTHQMHSTPWQTNPSESRHRKPRVGVHGRQRKQPRASP